MAIKLYDLVGEDPQRPFSPHCWKAAMALAHKGLSFESVPTRFTGIRSIEDGAFKTVPVIRDGDRVVCDSFDIALYLERTYPDRPSLFGGEGGEATARFIERWSQLTIHPFLGAAVLMDIYDRLGPADQAFFRTSREQRFGKRLEDVPADRNARRDEWRAKLEPLRSTFTFQPFLGGGRPLFADYIVFSALQWVRVMSPYPVLEADDPVGLWFERCLDLHDGLGRRVQPAA